MVECLLIKKVAVGPNPVVVTWISDNVAVSIKEFADIQASADCRFTQNAYTTW